MADRAASAGTAVIEASAAMLAQGNRPNLDELLEICNTLFFSYCLF